LMNNGEAPTIIFLAELYESLAIFLYLLFFKNLIKIVKAG